MRVHFRRRFELLAYLLDAIIPIALVAVISQQGLRIAQQSKEIKELRFDIATIKLNTLVNPNAASFTKDDTGSGTSTASTTK